MIVDSENSSHPVTKFEIYRAITPLKFAPEDRKAEYERALAPLTAVRRKAVIEGIADVFREQYVDPDIGEKVISGLQNRETEGQYDKFTDDVEEFARQLNDDARSISGDQHLRILFIEPPPEDKNKKENETGDEDGDALKRKPPPEAYERMKKQNFMLDNPSIEQIHDKKIGILNIKGFINLDLQVPLGEPPVREVIGATMAQIASTDALIIDLRTNHGGSPDTVAFIEAYLLGGENEDGEAEEHLVDFVDRYGTVKESLYTPSPSFRIVKTPLCSYEQRDYLWWRAYGIRDAGLQACLRYH